MPIFTPLYAAVLAVLFFVLSWRVLRYRRSNRVSLGDGSDPVLLTRIRAQGNLTESAPLGLILLLMIELQGAPHLLVNILGLMLVGGRLSHAYALSQIPMVMRARVAGMVLTLTMILIAAVTGFVMSLTALF